jgi:S1-C subfamily serine protease
MKNIVLIIMFFCISITSAFAENKINLIELNNLVEQTNFIVDRGCSGTLIDLKNKLILTNYHCITNRVSVVEKEETDANGIVRKVRSKRYADVPVEQHGYSGFARVSTATYVTEIVAEDQKVDLAILRIKSDIPHRISSRILPDNMNIIRGQNVYAVGNPSGMDATIVNGIISNLNRTFEFPWTGNEKLPMIQFSGGIYGGNSGGALYNEAGYLIGVPAAGHREATFIGLAIPISIVKSFLNRNCLAEAFDSSADNAKCDSERKTKAKKDLRQ